MNSQSVGLRVAGTVFGLMSLAQLARLHPQARGRFGGREVNYVEALGAMLAESARLYDLADGRPGLVRDGHGACIEVEVWEMSTAAFGSFVAQIPPPLGIGTLALEDGEQVKGFVCEAHAVAGKKDVPLVPVRQAAARAANRRGCSTKTCPFPATPASSSAGGTRVVFPAPVAPTNATVWPAGISRSR